MANQEHLEMLKHGATTWNEWRRVEPETVIHLSGANLNDADLTLFNLSKSDLRNAVLERADLRRANLTGANLDRAILNDAQLAEACLIKANLREVQAADVLLTQANLSNSILLDANLNYGDLTGATLNGADLTGTSFVLTNLSGATLKDALLMGTRFKGTTLRNTAFGDAKTNAVSFDACDLSKARGLETVSHLGPSSIGIDSLYKSRGEIPECFLRACGVPEDVIEHLIPLIRAGPPIQWHSSFISYSSKDGDFAEKLYARMREANMRVWFAPEDLKGGRKLHEQLFDAIQIHDRLLLVLSEHSMRSEWVMTEIRKAREVERKENRRKLFPIRLCSFDELRDWTCFDADSGKDLAVEVREYYIPDFSEWKDHDAFEKEFEKLRRDLKTDQKPITLNGL